MVRILVAGSGKIGTLVACLLAESGDYEVHLGDLAIDEFDVSELGRSKDKVQLHQIDGSHYEPMKSFFSDNQFDAVISALPYFCNPQVAKIAQEYELHYFDLTEDVAVTNTVKHLAHDAPNAFVPQCGLAPGFVSIAANHLIRHFDELDAVLLRVGALPVHPNNALKYSLTWSTDGLINEYGNLCEGINNYDKVTLLPLGDLETIQIDGLLYEAFNTSGGIGSLVDTYEGKVDTMNYKTLRYPGHCEKMRLLMIDLKLNHHREILKEVLENAIPKTLQDVVLVYVAVRGKRNGDLFEETYVKKVYPEIISEKQWSAIQVTTASGVCAVVDIVLNDTNKYQGYVSQEEIDFEQFIHNRFGKYYA